MNVLIIEEFKSLESYSDVIEETLKKKYPLETIDIDLCTKTKDVFHTIHKKKYEIIFLDVSCAPGFELLDELNIKDNSNVILFSSEKEHSVKAWDTCACAFMLKPITTETLEKALKRIIHPILIDSLYKIQIQCFGAFEISYRGNPIRFKRKKSLEMLAILVDNLGADTSNERIRAYLWDYADDHVGKKAYVRQLAKDIRNTFSSVGINDVLRNTSGGYMLNKSIIECDYFEFLEKASRKKPVVYMGQFDWAILDKKVY